MPPWLVAVACMLAALVAWSPAAFASPISPPVLALPAPNSQLPGTAVTDVSMAGDPSGTVLAIAGTGWQAGSSTPTTVASWADATGTWFTSDQAPLPVGVVATGDTALARGADWSSVDGNSEHPIYLAETWQQQSPLCPASYGMAVARSLDGGIDYDAPVTIASPRTSSTFSQPAVASTGIGANQTVWVAYSETDWSQPCAGPGSTSTQSVQLAVSNDGGLTYVPASAFAPGAGASAPAITADTSDGVVYIAWWNATLSKIQVEHCTESGSTVVCGNTLTAATGVGDPGSLGSVRVSASPAVAWANGRLVIAWTQRGPDGSLDVDTTTLQADGTFTAPAPIAGAPHVDEYAPALSATPTGRVDLTYLDDSGGAGTSRVFTASSDTTLDTGEDWPPAPPVQTAPTAATPGPGAPSVGSPPAIASGTTETVGATQPTIVAWSDGTAGGAYTSRIAHGTVAPQPSVDPIVDAPRFAPTPITVSVFDPDADPLTYQVQKGNAPSSLSATTRRSFIYQPLQPAPGFNGTDTLSFTATDSNGRSTTIPIPISMHDGRPTVACSTVFRAPGAPIVDPTSLCLASDPDNDPTSMTIVAPVNGTIAADGSFVPAAVGNASVTVVVSDGVLTNSAVLSVKVQNLTQPGTPSVLITSPHSPLTVVVGNEVRFDGTATDPSTTVHPTITWTFGDGATQTGTTVYHAYSSTGSKVVTASIGGAEDRLLVQVNPRPIVLQSVRWLSLHTMKVTVTVGTGGSLSASLMRGSRKVGSATLKKAPALRKVTLTLHPKPIRGRGLVMLSLQLKGKQSATLRRALVVPAVAG
jgi:hypothetical protein